VPLAPRQVVAAVEAALHNVEELGGKRMLGPDPLFPGVEIGRFADPEGHLIGVITERHRGHENGSKRRPIRRSPPGRDLQQTDLAESRISALRRALNHLAHRVDRFAFPDADAESVIVGSRVDWHGNVGRKPTFECLGLGGLKALGVVDAMDHGYEHGPPAPVSVPRLRYAAER